MVAQSAKGFVARKRHRIMATSPTKTWSYTTLLSKHVSAVVVVEVAAAGETTTFP